ncbi:hypothetical protein SAMN05444161_8700 [Rhizobiales bacterium GAS191]|nr:hypothetical protein SAMN05444161_8700 [Rhizobiales bacterium GAS191]
MDMKLMGVIGTVSALAPIAVAQAAAPAVAKLSEVMRARSF